VTLTSHTVIAESARTGTIAIVCN